MAFTLYVETERWRAAQKAVFSAQPGLVPVIKGNGYGFGNDRLAEEATRLGAATVAVGLAREAPQVLDAFPGDVVVLTPAVPGEQPPELPERVIHTVGTVDGLRACAGRRVVVDCRTSLRRHGVTPDDLPAVRDALGGVQPEGFAVHLPLDRPAGVDPEAEVAAWLDRLRAAGLPTDTLYVSHLTAGELDRLRARHPDTALCPRVGTALWLGDRSASAWRASVQEVIPLHRGDRYGYRQRRVSGDATLVVVSGGTSHGIGLEAPRHLRGAKPRAKHLIRAGMAVTNGALSPFVWAGRQRRFAEPPHMQVSLLLLPGDAPVPRPGDEMEARVRYTTTSFDRLIDR